MKLLTPKNCEIAAWEWGCFGASIILIQYLCWFHWLLCEGREKVVKRASSLHSAPKEKFVILCDRMENENNSKTEHGKQQSYKSHKTRNGDGET
jgi:hypothetical protein